MSSFQKYFWTIYHLKFTQLYYRIYYRIIPKNYKKRTFNGSSKLLQLVEPIRSEVSFESEGLVFTFLNQKKTFGDTIDWNIKDHGKLWTYNLNYFDFLNQQKISKEEGINLIDLFLDNLDFIKDGLEPYPVSLRLINWIKFISKHRIHSNKYDDAIYSHALHLSKKLEYHLLGNHLLENGFALLFAAIYLSENDLYKKAKQILITELNEQILKDGAHFELSPMYHAIILSRVLDSINALQSNYSDNEFLMYLELKASEMLGWMNQLSGKRTNFPLLNDAAIKIAPSKTQLNDYAKVLKIKSKQIPLSESGYRVIEKNKYSMIIDVGNIGPDYIPGHAHADTFNFLVYHDDKPIIIEAGTSTYNVGSIRNFERSTSAHNTVSVDDKNSSEVWSSFRVAKRAKITLLQEGNNQIKARHDGYKSLGITHERTFQFGENEIIITDNIIGLKQNKCKAFIHLHPDMEVRIQDQKMIAQKIKIEFEYNDELYLEDFDYGIEFNKRIQAQKLVIPFSEKLITKIKIAA